MPLAQAGAVAAGLILMSGAGMILCGAAADRAERAAPGGKASFAALCCLVVFIALGGAFFFSPGPSQLALLALGMLLLTGSSGVAGAIVTEGADPAYRATTMAGLILASNILGLAPGPFLTGLIADRFGLAAAMQIAAAASLAAALAFWSSRAPRRF